MTQAARLKKEVQDRIQTLGTEIGGSEAKLKQLEDELAEVQKREKGKVVRSSPGQKGGKLSTLVVLTRERINELRENLIRVREERDSSRKRIIELEEILSSMKEEYDPNYNDKAVKSAVRAWEDYAARDKGPEPEAARDRDLDEITKSDEENDLDWAQYEGGEENETDVCKFR